MQVLQRQSVDGYEEVCGCDIADEEELSLFFYFARNLLAETSRDDYQVRLLFGNEVIDVSDMEALCDARTQVVRKMKEKFREDESVACRICVKVA